MGKDKKKESKDWKPKKCEISPFVWSCIETVFFVEKITRLKKNIKIIFYNFGCGDGTLFINFLFLVRRDLCYVEDQ